MRCCDIISFVFLTILSNCLLVNGLISFCCKLLLSVIIIIIIIITINEVSLYVNWRLTCFGTRTQTLLLCHSGSLKFFLLYATIKTALHISQTITDGQE